MKKTGAICIAAVCLSAVLFASFPASADEDYIRGDANGDGIVSIKDVTAVQRVVAELEPDVTGMVAVRGNVAGKRLNITDATLIQQYLAEFDNTYHIGEGVAEPTKPKYELPFIED